MSLRGRMQRLEAALEEHDQMETDALRVWRRAVEWSEWAHRVHGDRYAALASSDSPPDSIRFTAFTWQIDDFLAPLVPQDCRLANWKRWFRCILSVVIDSLIESGASLADLRGSDDMAQAIDWCAELMRQPPPEIGPDEG